MQHAVSMTFPIGFSAPDDIRSAISRLGRTEDVAFSPSNRRLAIAGFGKHRLFVLDVEILDGGEPQVEVTGLLEISSTAIAEPHGVVFIDDDVIAVANRAGVAPLFALPPPVPGVRHLSLEPLEIEGTLRHGEVETPGSLDAHPIGADLYELFVCNNSVDRVTRHVLDIRSRQMWAGEAFVAVGLKIPDGVAVSRDHRWLAVSSHLTNDVHLFDLTTDPDVTTPAIGKLNNVNFPHGLRFTPDGEHVLVADAGAPFVHVFGRGSDDWRGEREPVATVRVMDDETYLRGRYNPQEGGPKGLDIDRTGSIVALTTDQLPLGLFPIASFTGKATIDQSPEHPRVLIVPVDEAARAALIREFDHRVVLEQRIVELERVAVTRDEAIAQRDAAIVDQDARLVERHDAFERLRTESAQIERHLTEHLDASRAQAAALDQTLHDCDAAWELAARQAASVSAELAAERADGAARTEYLNQVIDDRDRQLRTIHESRSWRVIRRLRRVASPLRRR